MTQKRKFTIFPAVHLREGQVIRFTSGNLQSPTIYSSDPIACVKNWIEQGAKWIQLINVDAAFDEEASHNWSLVEKICNLDVSVQFGGGIRTMQDVDWALNAGIDRVIIGTAAVENPQFMAEAIVKYGAERIIVAIDSDKTGKIRTHGWHTVGTTEAITFGIQMRHLGVTTAVYTDIQRDGSMTGIDWQSAGNLAKFTGLNVIAGGGVSSYDDIIACYHQDGIVGTVVGSALYTNKIQLDKALKSFNLKLSFDNNVSKWKNEQRTPWAKLRYKIVQNNLKKHLPHAQSLRILDAGGGNGRDAIPLAQMGHSVTLLDSSPVMLSDAGVFADEHQVADKMQYELAEVQDIGEIFEPDQFDAILCHEVLSYIDDPQVFLDTLIQPLKSEGILSVVGFNRHSLPYRTAFLEHDLNQALEMLDEWQRPSDTFDKVEEHYTGAELSQFLQNAGIEPLQYYGIRCMYDYWGSNEEKLNPETAKKLEALEMALTERSPYNLLARYFQWVGRKSSNK